MIGDDGETRKTQERSPLSVGRELALILSFPISSVQSCHVAADEVLNQQRRSMTASHASDADGPLSNTVPLGEGIPTKEELLVYYPAKFTWKQLKTFINSGYFYHCVLGRRR